MPHATADPTPPASLPIPTPVILKESVTAVKKEPGNPPRPRRPNYGYIHRHQLPIQINPLPTLIPHNPLSIIAIALSYLTQVLKPPVQPTYNGYFSSATSSIHITDERTIRALWEMGFFGKGNLSRSEPSWLAREKKKGETSEEYTDLRRNERREFKMERARKEQEQIAEKLRAERTRGPEQDPQKQDDKVEESLEPNGGKHDNAEPDRHDQNQDHSSETSSAHIDNIDNMVNAAPTKVPTADTAKIEGVRSGTVSPAVAPSNGLTPSPLANTTAVNGYVAKRRISNGAIKTVRFSPTIEAREFDLSSPVLSPLKHPGPSPLVEAVSVPKIEVENREHLELSQEEAFFLSYGLGVLNIFCDCSDAMLDSASLLALFRRHSYFPPHSLSFPAEPDDPFMVSYVVYHHFRSLGWVVRSGVKFSVDYLLYNRGPVFSHAEFAVVMLPAYSDPYWVENDASRSAVESKARRSWSWLHGINRVQSQVRKSLVLCYVDIPPPVHDGGKPESMDIGKKLQRYKVRDINVKRWTPNRSRD